MDYNKVQKKIFAEILSNKRVCYASTDDLILVTDGYVLYAIPKKKFYISLDAMQENDFAKVCQANKNDVEISPDGFMRAIQGRTVIRMRDENKSMSVWVNQAFLKKFPRETKFYASGNLSRVLCRDSYGNTLGVVLPIRMKEEE